MSETLNQYAVYRLRRDLKETRHYRHQSYQYLQEHSLKVRSDYYEQSFLAGFDPAMNRTDLRRQLEKELPAGVTGQTLGISDVLAITRGGITTAYYVDSDRLIALTGFFHVTSSGTALTIDTADFQIEGRPGNWFAIDEKWIDGQNFLLMQSQQFGTNAAYAVLDSHGRQAAEDTTKGFTDEIIHQIREYIRNQDTASHTPDKEQDTKLNADSSTDGDMSAESVHLKNDEQSRSEPPTDQPSESRFHGKAPLGSSSQKSYPTRRKKRRRGLPANKRESILKRLRAYKEKLDRERVQPN